MTFSDVRAIYAVAEGSGEAAVVTLRLVALVHSSRVK